MKLNFAQMDLNSFAIVCSLVRGPGIFGEVTVSWNLTPPVQKEFAEISGTLTMRDGQSTATVLIQVCTLALVFSAPHAGSVHVLITDPSPCSPIGIVNPFNWSLYFSLGSR